MSDPRPKGPSPEALREEILAQVTARGAEKSICPSEVARAFGENWQSLMTRVRQEALRLQAEGRLDILRKGKPVPREEVRGVIRLRLREAGNEPEPSDD